ncbi:uncharacterized protein LOC123316560 [Coccinella septempunctata]|uniref:uncharacterized protein LOC123316560 n=1 Tax=Coccinella septempunctata TaxID=41139 RepID=UPI001D06C5A4|nr:uncharacterized protein LOC123316560 [Coccinella septempunctata]
MLLGPAWHLHTCRGPSRLNNEKTFVRRREIHERRREKLLTFSRKRKENSKLRDYKKPHCFTIEDGRMRLKKIHNYFYQMQGQLNICKQIFCDFVLYSDDDFQIERIECDEALWKNIILPKLEKFYMNCILPELIDGRIPRGMRARDKNETRQ